jgi:hypothetical protein
MCNSSEEGNSDHGGKWKRISKHTGTQADGEDNAAIGYKKVKCTRK